jgi:hypothetical protein
MAAGFAAENTLERKINSVSRGTQLCVTTNSINHAIGTTKANQRPELRKLVKNYKSQYY